MPSGGEVASRELRDAMNQAQRGYEKRCQAFSNRR
jgi:hypothetical protein